MVRQSRNLWFWGLSLAVLALLFPWGLGGCGEDEPTEEPREDLVVLRGAYVVNEGNFGRGNASLSFYNADTGEVSHFVFREVNGRPLGDTANDIKVVGDRAYIVVNNSHTIEAIEVGTHRSIGTIYFPDGSGPYTLTVSSSGEEGYVPLLLSNELAFVDLSGLLVEDTVPVGANPTEAALAGGRLYVTDSGFGNGRTVTVVDVATRTALTTVEVGDNPVAAIALGDAQVLVLCAGRWDDFTTPDVDESTPGALVLLDARQNVVERTVPLESTGAGHLELGPDGRAYFLLNGNVWAFDPKSGSLEPDLVSAATQGVAAFYGLSVHPSSGELYATDAKDFQTPGAVYVFDASGAFVTQFGADLIPRTLGFVE
ncbi:MAG: hypothetical protein KatS3mg115_0960 [Candidatus Poribacteria bacterium]|nr:MAG: hypothetical protein KatS3mg115_0960 [Candidatus Poribacteria bacterium]